MIQVSFTRAVSKLVANLDPFICSYPFINFELAGNLHTIDENKVTIKEEPMSQTTYEHLVSDENEVESQQVTSLQNDGLQPEKLPTIGFHSPADQFPGAEKIDASMQRKELNLPNDFILDIRAGVSNLAKTVAVVEAECIKMKSLMANISQKLEKYEQSINIMNDGVVIPNLPESVVNLNEKYVAVTDTIVNVNGDVSYPSSSEIGVMQSSNININGDVNDYNHKRSYAVDNKTDNNSADKLISNTTNSSGGDNDHSSSRNCTNGNMLSPSGNITIKQEIDSDEEAIEFYRHSEKRSPEKVKNVGHDSTEVGNITIKQEIDSDEESIEFYRHSEKRSPEKVKNVGHDSTEVILKRKTSNNICENLKRKFEREFFGDKKKSDLADRIDDETSSSTDAWNERNDENIFEKPYNQKQENTSQCLSNEGFVPLPKRSKRSPSNPSNSVKFEIDSDGFTVPQMLLKTQDDDTVILKGVPIDEAEVGMNLDDVELEPFFTFSQVVNEMDDEIGEEEKEYLLSDKKRNRTIWNNACKAAEGVKYSPLLVKSKGRMKAAHKASVGKEAAYVLVKKGMDE